MEYDDVEEALDQLSKQARVAIAATFAERLRVLYQLGNVRCTVGETGLKLPYPPGDDLYEAGLKLAWQFAETGKADVQLTDALAAWLKAKFYGLDDGSTSAGSQGALNGVLFALMAITDDSGDSTDQALSQTEVGVSISLRQIGLRSDEDVDIPGDASDQETAWQCRVVAHALKNKKKPVSRELFAKLLAEKPDWHQYLDQYKAKFQPSAAR